MRNRLVARESRHNFFSPHRRGDLHNETEFAASDSGMRSEEESSSKGKVVVVSGPGGKVEEVRVSLLSRSIRFYSSSSQQEATTDAPHTEEDGTRPPSVPRSRWLFPEEELPVLQWRRPRRCGVGLGNPHALCFMNAVLQALAYTPGVADDLLEGRHSSRCPLATSTAAARRHARMLQQRSGAGRQSAGSSQEPAATTAGVGAGEVTDSIGRGKQLEGLMRRTTRGGSRTSTVEKGTCVPEAESDAAVSFCLLCKLEEQIQSIHCACPSGASAAKQQPQDATTEGVVRGFVRNRFSRYVKQFVWRRYREGRQEDAHEFLRYLLDALMRCGSGSNKRGTDSLRMPPEVWLTSYFGQLFGGWLQSSVCCSSCGYCSRRFDACLDLPLDLTPAPASPASWPSVTGGAVGGDAAAAAAVAAATASSGKRRFNSSSSRAEDAGGAAGVGGGAPASKILKRKVFAASTTAADGQCTGSRGPPEITGKESHHHSTAATAATASRRSVFSGGRLPGERKRKSLREGGSTIEKALQHFVAQEYLTGDNSYSCPQCKQKRPATKQLRVYTPPRVLVLPIKRFAVGCWGGAARGGSCYSPFAAHSFLSKNQAPVAFPAVLNLAPYMVSSGSEATTCVSATTNQRPCGGSSIAASPTTGCLKEERVDAYGTATAGCPPQETQQSTSLRLEKLSTVSEKRQNSIYGTGKEDEASPRSDASANSTSTRASSSPSPSPSRDTPPFLNNGPIHNPAASVSSSDVCDANETLSGNRRNNQPVMCLYHTTSQLISTDQNTAGISSPRPGSPPAGNGDRNSTTALGSAAPSGGDRYAAPPPLYQLYAVVTHTGSSLSSGHYRCFVRAPASATTGKVASEDGAAATASMWLLIDDEVVQTVSEVFVLQRLQHDAYLLFYSRIPSAQQQQELLLKEQMEKQQCLGNAVYNMAGQGLQHHRHKECCDADEQNGRWEFVQNGGILTRIHTSCRQTRKSLSSDTGSLGENNSHLDSSSNTWGTGSSNSDHSDECSASSNSTCSSISSECVKWSDDEEPFRRYTRRTAARLRSRQYAVPLVTARAGLRTSRKSIFSFLQHQKVQQEGSSTYFSYGKKFRMQRLLALQVSLLLRRGQKQSRVDTTTTRAYSQLEGEHLQQTLQSQPRREEPEGSKDQELQRQDKQVEQEKENVEGRTLRGNSKKSGSLRSLRILSTEEMRGRMKAASSFATQYGVARPGEWSDEEERSDGMAEVENDAHLQSLRELALERLQELQQPRRVVRNRHDREYDRGKVKKVKKKLSTKELAVGETVVVKSRDGDSTALVVHQRTAFDKVLEQQKQGGSRKVRFHTKKQQRHGKQGSSCGRGKQNRRGGRKYGQANPPKRKFSDK